MLSLFTKFFVGARRERLGAAIILSLTIFVFFLPKLFPFFLSENEPTNFSAFEAELKQFQSQSIASNENSTWRKKKENIPIKLFHFNPNLSSKEDFLHLGLSERLVNTIINYRNKGGKFFKKEDLKKIYGFRDEDYNRLKDYIILSEKNKESKLNKENKNIDNQQVIELFEFNPNTATKADFLRLGLSKKLANTISNYRNKGGKFFQAIDFKKVYGLKSADFERLLPYIIIENRVEEVFANIPKEYESYTEAPKHFDSKIDINMASAEEWQKLNGIGPAFSKRILKFRDALGGFYKIEQVAETYGFPDSTFQKIKTQLELSPILEQININQANYKTLIKHPYLNKSQTKAILNYRKQHETFKNESAFKAFFSNFGLDKFERLKPYLIY